MDEVLSRLLQAHVRHELAQLQGDQLTRSIERAVSKLFGWFETVTLNEVVTRAQINGVIERYVIELRVSGGITELVGELSQLVLHSRGSSETRVSEIFSPASYAEFADKLMGLDRVRRELIALVAHSTTFAEINARLLSRSLLDMFVPTALRRPGPLAAALASVWGPLSRAFRPDVEKRLAELLEHYLDQNRERLTRDLEQRLLQALNPDTIRSLLDEIWDGVAGMQLSEAFQFLGEQDLEDFVVLVHEFWLRYRKSDFFRAISAEMVDHFFAKYGDETLSSLIDDMGVSQAMVSAELNGFLQPWVSHALQSGALEQLLRDQLSDFYGSDAALAALESAQS